MATVKNFGLKGVNADVQFGKSGGRIIESAGDFTVFNSDGTTEAQLSVALTPSAINHATSKQYVDSVVTGLDVKTSVVVATSAAGEVSGFTYTASDDDGVANANPWTNVTAPVFDGVTLTDGDRVLIKDSADAKGNGIFTYNDGANTFDRTTDADNTPGNEVSGGMFTFAESGATQADNGYVMSSPTGNAVLGTDDLVFSQFSGAGQITAGDGLVKSGNTIDVVGTLNRIDANANNVDISASYVGQASITTLGTVTTGTWTADTIAVTRGGTGLATIADKSVLVSTGADTLSVLTVGASSVDQVLLWDDSADDFVFVDVDTVGSAYSTITADAGGSVTAVGSETLNLVGLANGGIQSTASTPGTDTISLDLTLNDLTTGGATLALGDFIAINDSGDAATVTALKYTFQDMVDDLNIVNGITANGILVRTTGDTYASRTIVASAVASEEGIIINNGDGVAGNPEVGLDIDALTLDTTITGTETLVIFDGVNNVKTRVSDIVSGSTVAWTTINGNSGTATADVSSDTLIISGSDGIVTAASDDPETLNIQLDITNLGAITVAGADEMVFDDNASGTHGKSTVTSFLLAQDIINGVGQGFAVVTDATSGAQVYANRTLAVNGVGALDGLAVADGNGVGGDPTFGLDINGLTLDTTIEDSNELVMYNGTANVKVTVGELIGDIDNAIIIDGDGDTSVAVDNAGVDNDTITFTASGGTVATLTSALFDIDVQIGAADGTEAAPTYSFGDDLDTGIYSNTANELCIVGGGKDIHCFRIESGKTGDEHLVTEASDGEGRLCAEGDATNVDIRICPKGTGVVLLGEVGSAASIATSDGANASASGEDLTITAGDSGVTSGDGGDIVITPGSGATNDGSVCITDDDSFNVMCFEGVDTATNYVSITNAATGVGPIFAVEGEANIDLRFLGTGTGVLTVTGTTNYEAQVTDDDDIPNKAFVDAAVAATLSGAISTISFAVDLATNAVVDTGLVIPAGATILRTYVNVTTLDTTATLTIGTVAGAGDEYMTATDNDPSEAVLYQVDDFDTTVGTVEYTVASTNATGVGAAIIEYRNAT